MAAHLQGLQKVVGVPGPHNLGRPRRDTPRSDSTAGAVCMCVAATTAHTNAAAAQGRLFTEKTDVMGGCSSVSRTHGSSRAALCGC